MSKSAPKIIIRKKSMRCAECGNLFKKRNGSQKTCGVDCSIIWRRKMHRKISRRWEIENPEKRKKIVSKWTSANRKKINERVEVWKKKNPQKMALYNEAAKYKRRKRLVEDVAYRESVNLKRRQSRAKNPYGHREENARWRTKHKEKARQLSLRLYYEGPKQPTGELQWLRKALALNRQVKRMLKSPRSAWPSLSKASPAHDNTHN
jgi:hypothetical protein